MGDELVNLGSHGVPESPFQFHYFLCHADSDRDTAVQILYFLEEDCGYKVFYEPRDGHPAKTECENLEYGITNSKFILVLLSVKSIRCDWFNFKIKATIDRCLETRFRSCAVVPICIGVNHAEAPPLLRSCTPLVYDESPTSSFWTKLRKLASSKVQSSPSVGKMS